MEQAHTSASQVMREANKLMPLMPAGAFRLLLQAILQHIIKLKGQHVRRGKPKTAPQPSSSFMDIIPDGEQSQNLPVPVCTLTAVIAFLVKAEFVLKSSIMGKASKYDMPEKKLKTVS